MIYFHGTHNPEAIINAIIGNGKFTKTFHMTPSMEVAKNYGSVVIAIELESDLTKAHIGIINKDGNMNKSVGTGIEVVLTTPAAVTEFYHNVVDAYVI